MAAVERGWKNNPVVIIIKGHDTENVRFLVGETSVVVTNMIDHKTYTLKNFRMCYPTKEEVVKFDPNVKFDPVQFHPNAHMSIEYQYEDLIRIKMPSGSITPSIIPKIGRYAICFLQHQDSFDIRKILMLSKNTITHISEA